jgi:phosphoenolpyruvate synthase/pyruvate phosphate dikinase
MEAHHLERTNGFAVRLVWLGDRAANDAGVVGAKAANLSRLAGAYRVPPGFCLTAAWLEAELGPTAHDAEVDLPRSMHDEVFRAYAALAESHAEIAPPVAVRSSAIDEDGSSASFAGQHETYLNVRGECALARSIVRCWRSLYSPRALEYRRQRGVALDGTGLAVVVQLLVKADSSAVVFSANPMTRSREQAVLTATWGLGESLVGGSVSPDSYLVRKSDLALEMRHIATKRRMTVLVEGGTEEVDVPSAVQVQPAIDNTQVVEAVRVALDLERRFGVPIDLECAWADGLLYVLQCRPITTL